MKCPQKVKILLKTYIENLLNNEEFVEDSIANFSRKTQVLLCGEIKNQISDLKQINKFCDVDSIGEILGDNSCYIKQCRNSSTYVAIDESYNGVKRDQIIAAAVPINFPLIDDKEIYYTTKALILQLIEKSVPTFFISEPECHLYYIWLINEKDGYKVKYECPHSRTDKFVCLINKSGFCEKINDDEYYNSICSLLNELKKITKQICLPVFQLSTFIDYCIADHHYTDRKLGVRSEKLQKNRFAQRFRSIYKHYNPEDSTNQ